MYAPSSTSNASLASKNERCGPARPRRMTHRMGRCALPAVALWLALSLASAGARADGDETAMTNLVALVSQRLALAVPVAQWKWANHRPISDESREAALLAEVTRRAQAADVDPAFARAFFQDQFDASK